MSESPFFSIIVPAYNVEAYIEHTIQSILGQTCSDYELILVNDGSTDGTDKICQRYTCSAPHKIQYLSQENRGVSNARNTGMQTAKGRYLVFVDGDDYLAKTALEEMKACLQDQHADLLFCDFRKCVRQQEPRARERMKKTEIITPRECILSKLKAKIIPVYAACYSRDMIVRDHIRFDEELRFVEDALFFFTCVKHAESILHYPAVLYCYVQRADSATHNGNAILQQIRCELKGWRKIKKLLAGDREIRRLLLARIQKIQRNYRRLCFFRFMRRIARFRQPG